MNTFQSVSESIMQVIIACTKGMALFAAAQSEPVVNGWCPLDPARASEAYRDLEAALQAVRSIEAPRGGEDSQELLQYLDRAENALEYTLATICTGTDNQAKAHASRAQSAQHQLAGLRVRSELSLERMGRSVG